MFKNFTGCFFIVNNLHGLVTKDLICIYYKRYSLGRRVFKDCVDFFKHSWLFKKTVKHVIKWRIF